MKKLLEFIFGKKYIVASDSDVRAVNFQYSKALKDLKDYDAGKLKNVDITPRVAALQDYFRKTKGHLTSQ
jgi:hypothetical protein